MYDWKQLTDCKTEIEKKQKFGMNKNVFLTGWLRL
jgi:hypothetical protein